MTSLSNLKYSAIGFSKTKTEEFEDLKTQQADLTQRLDGVVVWHHALLQKKEEADEKAAKEATAAALTATATEKTAEIPAKAESTETKTAEEGGEPSTIAGSNAVKIKRSVSEAQYCETRADLINDIQTWASEAGRKIALFPSKRSADRIRRTIDSISQFSFAL